MSVRVRFVLELMIKVIEWILGWSGKPDCPEVEEAQHVRVK
jgi:hypothetical protein